MNIKRDDKVIVLSGKDKGKQGKVLSADPKAMKVVVEGVNVATKHQKPQKQGQDGGIIKVETPIYACKVHAGLPQVRQGYPCRPQDSGRQEGPCLQEVRHRNLRKEITDYDKNEEKVS